MLICAETERTCLRLLTQSVVMQCVVINPKESESQAIQSSKASKRAKRSSDSFLIKNEDANAVTTVCLPLGFGTLSSKNRSCVALHATHASLKSFSTYIIC